jgi:hypothetical protein
MPINFEPSPTATCELLATGEKLPYWLFLRILHYCATSIFQTSSAMSVIYVQVKLHRDGFQLPDHVVVIIEQEYMTNLTEGERGLLRILAPERMQPSLQGMPFNHDARGMQSLIPSYLVNPAELVNNQDPPLVPQTGALAQDVNTPAATQAPRPLLPAIQDPRPDVPSGYAPAEEVEQDAAPGEKTTEEVEAAVLKYLTVDEGNTPKPSKELVWGQGQNANLYEQTSVPITTDNAEHFFTTPMPAQPAENANDEGPSHLPSSQWPRAPPAGQPPVDAFTGFPMELDSWAQNGFWPLGPGDDFFAMDHDWWAQHGCMPPPGPDDEFME